MLIKATQKNTRQTPRKVRLIANTVRKLSLEQALKQLAVIEKRATIVVLKTLKQAIANAMNNHGYAFEDLHLENILVTQGPRYKRFQAVSRGRAHSIVKSTSHITVILRAGEKKVAPVQKETKKITEVKKVEKIVEAKKELKTSVKKPAVKTVKKIVKKDKKK